MARGPKPQIHYYPQRNAYCVTLNRTLHTLATGPDDAPSGPTYLAALDQFRKIVELDMYKGTDKYLVSALLNQYRAHLKATRKSAVPGIFDIMAKGFAVQFGHLRVLDLKPHMVEEWLAKQDRWNNTSKAHAGTLILAAVSWARKKGFIQNDPIGGRVDLPEPVLRGREARMSKELMDLLIEEAHANKMRSREFGELLWFLRCTGARPGELRNAEAHNYERGRLVYRWNTRIGYVHKTAKTTQRDRVIYLTTELQRYIESLIVKHPAGKLFRSPRGGNWTLQGICNKWQWLLKRPKVVEYLQQHEIDPDTMKMYNFRHSWASDYLDGTGDIFGCAQMLGTSVKMIQTRYGHPDVEKLHDKYTAFMASR